MSELINILELSLGSEIKRVTEGHINTLTCTVSKTLFKQKETAKDGNNSVFREHFRIINNHGTEMTQC